VKITYDETVIDLKDLLHIFYAAHDGSIPNHPPLGMGSQYRSVIFYIDETEAEPTADGNGVDVGVIPAIIEELQTTFPHGVLVSTQVMSAKEFYQADELHYNYYQQHSADDYCLAVIAPKLQEVKNRFPDKFL
jgi:peptide-methionine (S)-S-oxide reductase